MEQFEHLRSLVSLIPIFLFFIINIYGMRYDAVSEKFNKYYKGNHSVTWRCGKLSFSIPGYIFQSTNNPELEKAKKNYNRLSVSFWTSALITVLFFIF